MRKKKNIVEIYDLSVTVFVGGKSEIEAKLQKVRPDFKMGYGITKPVKKSLRKYEYEYEIFINLDQKKHSPSSILVHELTHVVDLVSGKIGASEEKECRAYLMGHLFEKFEKFIQAAV